jgi:hypothetical protein
MGQQVFLREARTDLSYRPVTVPPLHVRQVSRRNVGRYVRLAVPSGLLVWYGGDTDNSEQGTILVYRVSRKVESCWFASFRKRDNWRIDQMHGISRRGLAWLLQAPAADILASSDDTAPN